MFLSRNQFSNIVRTTPLISIDFCILRGRKILLGKRLNPPAKDFYFVPGGRIFKLERKEKAIQRILINELGFTIKNHNHKCIKDLGTYEHFYEENFLGNKDFSTHYIVIAYLIPFESLIKNQKQKVSEQHSSYFWFDIDNHKNKSYEIHPYTLSYLKHPLLKKEN